MPTNRARRPTTGVRIHSATGVTIYNATRRAEMRDALSDAVSAGFDLSEAMLARTIAEGYYYNNSRALRAIFDGSNFADGSFEAAFLEGALFRFCNLEGVNFYGASLTAVNFRGSMLRNANFRAADCRGANFTGCDLRDTDFRNARLDGAIFTDTQREGMRLDNATGFDPVGPYPARGESFPPVVTSVPPRAPRNLLEYAKWRNARVKVSPVPVTGPLPAGSALRWHVRLSVGKKRLDAEVESATMPTPVLALDLLRRQARQVDNGRGDCNCGCGIHNMDYFADLHGYSRRNIEAIRPRYEMCKQSSQVLRAAFGNANESGYPHLQRMSLPSTTELTVETW